MSYWVISDDIWVMSDLFFSSKQPLRGCWFPCFHHSLLNFHHSSLKNGGTHKDAACLDLFSSFISITQFLHFLVMSYKNWKQVLGVFELWKLSYDVIFVNTHTCRGPTIRGLSPRALLFTHTPPMALMSSNPFTPSSNKGPLHHHFSLFLEHHFSPFLFILHPSTQLHQKIE